MPALLPVILATSQLWLAANQVPELNIEPSCAAAAQAAVELGRTEDNCKSEEYDARNKLKQDWSKYSAAQQQHCTLLSALGGFPSYVELLTCLEMEQAVDSTRNSPDGAANNLLSR